MTHPPPITDLKSFLDTREKELIAETARIRAQLIPLEAELVDVRRAMGKTIKEIKVSASSGRGMTIKKMCLKALAENFPEGATTKQLVEFFNLAWGNSIQRTTLSPQLSRLCTEGKIIKLNSTWKLP